ncbi:hypothetical protein GLOIN_2v1866787, partial [Rhizophagus irregularis DAOM 181602=DAOM 197198]
WRDITSLYFYTKLSLFSLLTFYFKKNLRPLSLKAPLLYFNLVFSFNNVGFLAQLAHATFIFFIA